MAETKALTGGCLCGRVRYAIAGEPVNVAKCHCRDCQRATGGGHIAMAAFPADAIKVTGELKTFTVNGESGKEVVRHFCPNCGSLIMGRPAIVPHIATITLGTLDDPEAAGAIRMAFYTRSRPSWDASDPSIAAFDAMPPRPN